MFIVLSFFFSSSSSFSLSLAFISMYLLAISIMDFMDFLSPFDNSYISSSSFFSLSLGFSDSSSSFFSSFSLSLDSSFSSSFSFSLGSSFFSSSLSFSFSRIEFSKRSEALKLSSPTMIFKFSKSISLLFFELLKRLNIADLIIWLSSLSSFFDDLEFS